MSRKYLDGWMGGRMGGSQSRVKDCLQQSKKHEVFKFNSKFSDNVFKPDKQEQQLLKMTCTIRGFQLSFLFLLFQLQFLSILICHSNAKVQKGKLSHSHLQVKQQQHKQKNKKEPWLLSWLERHISLVL